MPCRQESIWNSYSRMTQAEHGTSVDFEDSSF